MKPEKATLELLINLEKKLLNPEVRKSAQELSGLLRDDFLEFGSSGRVYNKEEIIIALLEEIEVKICIKDLDASELAPGVVLLTYKAVKTGTGANKEVFSLRSSIWRLSGSGWQIMFHQGTLFNNC